MLQERCLGIGGLYRTGKFHSCSLPTSFGLYIRFPALQSIIPSRSLRKEKDRVLNAPPPGTIWGSYGFGSRISYAGLPPRKPRLRRITLHGSLAPTHYETFAIVSIEATARLKRPNWYAPRIASSGENRLPNVRKKYGL